MGDFGAIRTRRDLCKQVTLCEDYLHLTTSYDGASVGASRLAWYQVCVPHAEHCFGCFNLTASVLGSVNLVPAKKQPSGCTWDGLFDSDTIPPPRPDGVNAEECLLLGATVVATSGDVCKVGSWVFYCSPHVRHAVSSLKVVVLRTYRWTQAERRVLDGGEESTHRPTMAGRIFKIIATKSPSRRTYVIMEPFNVSGSRDNRYGMPTMRVSSDSGYQIIPPSVSCRFP